MMAPSAISGIIARLSDRAGIDRICAHRPRHTAAMDVLAAGGTLTEAQEFLGHVYTVTSMAYAKVDLASLREGDPVQARPDALSYLLRRAMRRHRAGSIIGDRRSGQYLRTSNLLPPPVQPARPPA